MAKPRTFTDPRVIPRYLDVIKLCPGARKIGKTPVTRLAWLLRFAQSELPTAEKALQRVDEELAGFLLLSGIQFFTAPARHAESIRELRDDLLEHLRLVVNWNGPVGNADAGWWVPLDGLGRWVRKGFISGYQGSQELTRRTGAVELSRHQLFMVVAAELVGSPEGKRIQVCARKGCERLCVRRKRGLYCGPACSQREQTRKYRERLNDMRRQWRASQRAPQARTNNALPRRDV